MCVGGIIAPWRHISHTRALFEDSHRDWRPIAPAPADQLIAVPRRPRSATSRCRGPRTAINPQIINVTGLLYPPERELAGNC